MANLAGVLWRIVRGDRLALSGLVILVAMLGAAVLAPLIAPYDPNAVHERVEGVAVHFDGQRWRDVTVIGDAPLNDVALSGAGQGVAVGFRGAAALLEGGSWRAADVSWPVTLRGVDAAGGLTVAVGDSGLVLHLDGGQWRAAETPSSADLHAVAVASATHALAVGDAGTVLRWDGQAWSALDAGVERDLYAVVLVGEAFGMVAGARGTLLTYDGGGLVPVEGLGFRDLYGIDALGPDRVLAVGERGTILLGEDGHWAPMRPPESRDLRDVRLIGDGGALAVGTHGVVLRLDDGQWTAEDTGYEQTLRGVASYGGELVAVGTDPFVNRLASPSREHLFGTTHLGRDIFSQTIWGSRTALTVGLLAALTVVLIGTNVGLVAGYFKGATGSLLMRFVDVMYALPFEPFALVLVLIFRPSLAIVILAIGLLTWRTTARIIRSQVLSLSERPFVKAARVAGASDWRIMYVHIAPNVLPLAFLQLAVAMAFAITAEATLSFLGLGPPQVYSWGTILHEARLSGAWRTAWWWIIPPGLFIMVTVVAVFFIARALEVLTNPRLAGGA